MCVAFLDECLEVCPYFISCNLVIPIFEIAGVEPGLQEKGDSIIEQLLRRVGILSEDLYLLAIFDASKWHLRGILGGIHILEQRIVLE